MKIILTSIIIAISCAFASAQEANEAALIDFLKKHVPEVHESILQLRKDDPVDYREALKEVADARAEYRKVVSYNDRAAVAYLRMFELDFFAIGVSDQFVRSENREERKQLKEELTDLIDESFAYWVIYERARLDQLEKQLQKARQNFEKEAADKPGVVEQDVEQIIEDSREYLREKGS